MSDEVLFESPIASRTTRVVISVVTGAAFVGATGFLEWGLRAGRHMPQSLAAGAIVGASVTWVMLWSTFTSRTVRRVVVLTETHAVALHPDAGATVVIPLGQIASVRSAPVFGGYSRDPAEQLVVTLRDGSSRSFQLPDEADTPAIAEDLRKTLG